MNTALGIYNATTTLQNIDLHVVRVLVFGGLSLTCNFIFFGAAASQGFKHQIYTIPLAGTLLFIPHDFLYLLMFHRWFYVYAHWFPKLFWCGLIVTNCLEGVFFYQTLKWGRRFVLPQVSQGAYAGILCLALAGATVSWLAVKSVLADPLWLFSFGWTVWFCTPFVIPMMLRRGTSQGQTLAMWVPFILMAVTFWIAVWPLDPFFRSPQWLALGAVTVAWALAIIYVMRKLPSQPLSRSPV